MAYVRVKDDKTSHELSVTEEWAALMGLKPINKPAVDASGYPLPPKYHRSIEDAAAAANKKGA